MNDRGSTPLKLVCVGAGRDGTVSVSHMVREMFDREGAGRTVAHEYCAREFLHCFTDFAETGEERYREQARTFIRECPYDCIVGAGPAPWIGLFHELLGPELRVVHLRRRNRARGVASLAANAELFPFAYGYYSDSPEAFWRRMAAFHYAEMSRETWFALSLEERIGWYFDKTHALTAAALPRFSNAWTIYTEDLDTVEARTALASAAGIEGVTARAKHLNTHAFVEGVPAAYRDRMQWLFGQLDLQAAATDDVYLLQYVLNAFISWTGYQVRQAPQIASGQYPTAAELRDTLSRALASVDRTRALIGALQREVDERYPEDKQGE